MSVSAFLDITLHLKNSVLSDVFPVLLSSGWTVTNEGPFTYMDTGDEFEWSEEKIDDIDEVLSRLNSSLNNMKPVGIILTWPEPLSGGMFVIFPKDNLLSLWPSHRKTLSSASRWTDFSWYLERYIAPLQNAGIGIECIKCEDY